MLPSTLNIKVTYSHTNFEVATSNSLGRDIFTRNVADERMDDRSTLVNILYFSEEKAGINI